jgi:hypothetical protein
MVFEGLAAIESKTYPANIVLIESDTDSVSIIKKFLKKSGWKALF